MKMLINCRAAVNSSDNFPLSPIATPRLIYLVYHQRAICNIHCITSAVIKKQLKDISSNHTQANTHCLQMT